MKALKEEFAVSPDLLSEMEEKIVERWPGIFAFFMNKTRDSDLSGDLTQKVYLKALSNNYGHVSNIPVWLIALAKNVLADHYRGIYRDQRRHVTTPIENLAAPDKRPNAERLIMDSQFNSLIAASLGKLSAKERDALIRFHFKKTPIKEIAQSAGVAEVTIHVRLKNARVKLRQAIESARPVSDPVLSFSGRLRSDAGLIPSY